MVGPDSPAAVLRPSAIRGRYQCFRQWCRASAGGEPQIGKEVRNTEGQNQLAHSAGRASGLGTRTIRDKEGSLQGSDRSTDGSGSFQQEGGRAPPLWAALRGASLFSWD